MSVTKSGFGLATTIGENSTSLDELYYDFATENAEWTVGRKPQEWAFGYTENALNWIDQDVILLREQFASFGSWQSWCYVNEANQGCATRASGWLGAADWQVMLGYQEAWRAGLGLQAQLGSGGLTYVELYASEREPERQLATVGTGVFQIQSGMAPQTQVNLGAQWTTRYNLTIQAEMLWLEHGLDQDAWRQVLQQLLTPQAGLVADAFSQPMGRSQYMVRFALPWHEFDVENVSLLWPEADNSLLNQLSVQLKVNSSFSIKTTWQHNVEGNVLRRIGQQDQVRVQFQFIDGL